MAEALVSIAVEKLADVVRQQLSLFAGVNHELEKISSTFQSIQAVVAVAESRQVEDKSVQLWLSRLRQVAYDTDDIVVEGRISDSRLGKQGNHDGDGDVRNNKVCSCLLAPCNCLGDAFSRCKFKRRVKEIRERLDHIADDRNKLGFSSSSLGGDHMMLLRNQRLTTSRMEESESEMIVGRENDREILISKLVSGNSNHEDWEQAQVVAIVGIGGLGKTTLARLIFHDAKVRDHFSQAVYWVCVSEAFDLTRLTKEILEEVRKASCSFSGLNELRSELLQSLRGKRFLLVLDDVWNDDAEMWGMLRLSLTSGAPGSRILVTTRSEKVAYTMDAAFIHQLQGLSDDQSWTLFSSRAFAGRKADDCSEFESIGKEIVSKCKGVPLSIKVIGSAMYSKRTVEEWKNVLESKAWSLPQATDKILPALLLTYSNLPTHLKQCFAYCSVFPKDWVLHKDMLIRLWSAQGLIRLDGNRDTEDIGEEYFDELVAWSMLQEVRRDYRGTRCKMHDLLHDLAEFIAKDEIYSLVSSEGGRSERCPGRIRNIRHAFLSFTDKPIKIPIASGRAQNLRTLILDGFGDGMDSVIVNLLGQARFLRALVFVGSVDSGRIVRLPDSIGKIKHLRYLDLSYSGIVELPESVSHLLNLQTLNLSNCLQLKKLPKGMGRMVSLRHLEIKDTYELECLPKGLGRMTSLESLSSFMVEGGEGCGIDELQQLNYLQGTLKLKQLERVSDREEAEKAQIWNKPQIVKLVLEMSRRDDVDTARMESVLEGLRPHSKLEELELVCYCMIKLKLPSWLEDSSFTKLTKLVLLGNMQHCEQKNLPGLGKLPALKYLKIEDFGVRKLGNEFYYGESRNDAVSRRVAFPKLKEFQLLYMYELMEWELAISTSEAADAKAIIMPSLRVLELQSCDKLEGLPQHLARAPLTKLRIECCKRIKGRGCFSSFPFLETFTLIDSSKFFSVGLLDLPNLMALKIDTFRNETLPDEGWEQLVALQKLEIGCCKELKSLPDGLAHLQSLEDLNIHDCYRLESLPEGLGQLKSLKSLTIYGLDALTCLPSLLGQLESLEHLRLVELERLQSMPEGLGQLKALNDVEISDCHALGSLPDGLQYRSHL